MRVLQGFRTCTGLLNVQYSRSTGYLGSIPERDEHPCLGDRCVVPTPYTCNALLSRKP